MTITLSQILHSFFEDHLKLQKGLQPTSIRSYRDTVRLFLCHVAQDQRRRITQIRLQDLTFEQTQRFLQHLEVDRHTHVHTRNQRLCVCGVQLNVRVTLSAGKGAFWVIPEWVQGVAAGQMDESWINKHGQLDSKGGPWQNAFPKSRSLPGAKQV